MAEHKSIPKGWRFYTADFSVIGRKGRVMLTRDEAGAKWWHSLDAAAQYNISLYLTGFGNTVNEAIDDAIRFIASAGAAA